LSVRNRQTAEDNGGGQEQAATSQDGVCARHVVLHLEFVWKLAFIPRAVSPNRQSGNAERAANRFGMTLYRRGVIACDTSSCSSVYRSWSG
jgi:hypothetical protein